MLNVGFPFCSFRTNIPDQDRLGRCKEVLIEIESEFNSFSNAISNSSRNQRGKGASLKDRISWAFSKKRKIGELATQLEECKSSISLTFVTELLYIV